MTTVEKNTLIARQLDDILSQAERIIGGANDMEALENFSNYSEELKTFLKNNSTNPMILERVEKIPTLDLISKSWLSFFSSFMPSNTFDEQLIRSRSVEIVREMQGYYSSIQFLFKSEFG